MTVCVGKKEVVAGSGGHLTNNTNFGVEQTIFSDAVGCIAYCVMLGALATMQEEVRLR